MLTTFPFVVSSYENQSRFWVVDSRTNERVSNEQKNWSDAQIIAQAKKREYEEEKKGGTNAPSA